MNEEIGTIISTLESPSPSRLDFVVNKEKVSLHRGQFIQADYSEGTLIALITDLIKTNKYFERADSVKEFEANGSKLFEQFPVTEWEYLVARCKPLGVFKDGIVKRTTHPVSPGTKVCLADKEKLKVFLGLKDKGIHLGDVEHHGLKLELSMNRLIKKHLAILGISGCGKCVNPDSKILFSSGEIVKIGKLVDEKLEKGYFVEDGVQISTLNENNQQVISLDDKNNLVASKIKAFTRRKAPEEMYLIKTRTGKELELTPEHFVPVMTGFIEWKPSRDLRKEDYLLIPKPRIEGKKQLIDVIDLMKSEPAAFVVEEKAVRMLRNKILEKCSLKQASKKLQVNYTSFVWWLKHGMPLNQLIKLCGVLGIDFNELKQEINYLKGKHSDKCIPAYIELNEDFVALYAYLLAEGHAGYGGIEFCNENKAIQERFNSLMELIFREKPTEYVYKKNHFIIHNSLLVKLFWKLGFTSSSWTKFVHPRLLESESKVIDVFLSAFIDCDGHVNSSKSQIEITLASKQLIEGIESLFFRKGIICIKKPKFVSGKEYSRLLINGASNLKILSKDLSFLIPHKQERLLKWAKLKPNTNIAIVPNLHNHFKSLFRLLRMYQPQKEHAGINNYLHRRDNPSIESLKKLLALFEERFNECNKRVTEFNEFYSRLPKTNEEEALKLLKQAYAQGINFKQLSKGTGVSSTTARRMVRCLTTPTNKVYALANNALQLQAVNHKEINSAVLNIDFNEVAVQLNQFCKELHIELNKLCFESGLYSQALEDYVAGRRLPIYSDLFKIASKANEIVLELKEDLPYARKLIDFMRSLTKNEVFFDKIVSITKIKPNYEFVYDLSIENNHNFIANNLLIHNSHSVTVLLEELLERNKENGRIAALLFDVHGEYTHLAEPNLKGKDFSSKVNLVNANEITIAVPKLSVFMLSSIVPEMGAIQRRDLGRIIDRLQKQMRDGLGPYGFNEIKAEIAKDKEVKENTAQALIGWINELESMNLFGRTDNPSIQELVQPGTLTIIDLSDLINLKKKQTIVTYFLQKLFNDRRKGFCSPFIAIIEEAHQFAPEKASRESAISKSIIQTIAREGRKFLAGICLISQRPVQLSTTALSQCNTHLIMKVSNPYDLDHIGKSSESLDRQSLDMISSLRVGEALLVGEATNFPVFFKVRQRKSRESRHEKTLEEAAFEFEEKTAERNKEAKEFI